MNKWFTILVILVVGAFTNAYSQYVNFADPDFKSFCVSDPAINTDLDTNISFVEAAAYTGALNIDGKSVPIEDLTGLEQFTSITGLSIWGQYLPSVDVSANVALMNIDCSSASISNLILGNLPALTDLNCQDNDLTDLDLSGCPNLSQLNCSGNELPSLDLSNNPGLLMISANYNLLTSIDVTNQPNLEFLYLAYNYLTCVDVSLNSSLEELDVANNQLTALNIKNGNSINLTYFYATGNPSLTCIQVDDVAYASTMWTSNVDNFASFSLDCGQPAAAFTDDTPVCTGVPVTFDDMSSSATSWYWDFGDGNTSTLQNPTNFYTTGGTYNVMLQVYNCYGYDTAYSALSIGFDISGNATYSGGPVTNGVAIIYPYESYYTSFDTLQIQALGPAGDFQFLHIPDGNYIIQVFPDTLTYPTLIPTYYNNDWAWDYAIVINQGCVAPTTGINIQVGEIPTPTTGPGLLHGTIVEGPGFGRAQGDPIHGVVVKRGITGAMTIVETTETDTNGEYTFANIAYGDYTIYVDIPGLLRDSSYQITVDAANSQYLNLDYIVDSSSVYIVEPIGLEDETENSKLHIYPNPIMDVAIIEYQIDHPSEVEISIYNMVGTKVKSITSMIQPAGNFVLQLNNLQHELGSGMYMLTVSADGKSNTKRIVILK